MEYGDLPEERAFDPLAHLSMMSEDGAKKQAALAAKIAAVQDRMGVVPTKGHAEVTTRSGGSYSYDYIQESDLMAALRQELAKEGIAVLYDDTILHDTKQGDVFRTVVRVTMTLIDGETGWMLQQSTEGIAHDQGDKGANKAKTSAMRYLLWKMNLIPSDIDPEQENLVPRYENDVRERQREIARVEGPKRDRFENWGPLLAAIDEATGWNDGLAKEMYGAAVEATYGITLTKFGDIGEFKVPAMTALHVVLHRTQDAQMPIGIPKNEDVLKIWAETWPDAGETLEPLLKGALGMEIHGDGEGEPLPEFDASVEREADGDPAAGDYDDASYGHESQDAVDEEGTPSPGDDEPKAEE